MSDLLCRAKAAQVNTECNCMTNYLCLWTKSIGKCGWNRAGLGEEDNYIIVWKWSTIHHHSHHEKIKCKYKFCKATRYRQLMAEMKGIGFVSGGLPVQKSWEGQ